MGDDGIHDADEEGRVEQIRLHLRPLGDRAGDDGRQGAGEGELEEPVLEADVVVALEEEPALGLLPPLF